MARSLQTVIDSMISFMLGKNPTIDTSEGSLPHDVVISPVANEIVNLYETSDSTGQDQSILTADSTALERLADNFGLVKKGARPATGTITFFCTSAPLSNITIPAGTLVSTVTTVGVQAIQFTTLNAVVMYSSLAAAYLSPYTGVYEISAAIQAVIPGVDGIVGAGTINSVTSPISGINGCYNAYATSGGMDSEADDELRIRIAARFRGGSLGTKDGILSDILAQEGVEDAIVVGGMESVRNDVGSIDVYVKGSIPVLTSDSTFVTTSSGSALLDIVTKKQPVTDIISVQSVNNGVIAIGTYELLSDRGKYGGSIYGLDSLHWLSIPVFTIFGSDTIFVVYYYNSLIETLQSYVNQSDKHLLNTRLMVKFAVKLPIDVACSIKVLGGFDSSSVILTVQNAVTQFLSGLSIGTPVQQSDVAGIIINTPGVDDVLLPLTTFNSSDYSVVRDSFNDLIIPANSYASAGTITITVTA